MCGIAGYVGPRQAAPILLDSLQRLEYRGYDSCGLAVLNAGRAVLRRSVSPIARFRTEVLSTEIPGSIGLAHTRWATHGLVDIANAHPHVSCDGSILSVHNGVLENAFELREQLERGGHRFTSTTDSEVIPHLLEQHLADGQTMDDAFRSTLRDLRGSLAIIVARSGTEELYVARRGSPLVIGVGDAEYFPASDIPSFLPMTARVLYLQEDEPVVITRSGLFIPASDVAGCRREPFGRSPVTLSLSAESMSKGTFDHYMLKEIIEQTETIERLVEASAPTLAEAGALLSKASTIKFVGAGTSYHAAMFGQYLLAQAARIDSEACVSSEFEYRGPLLRPGAVVVALSQSGETADTLEAVRTAQDAGARVIAVTNNELSSLARVADVVVPLRSGPEIAVAATKSYTAQLVILFQIAQQVTRDPMVDTRALWQARDSLLDLTSNSVRARVAELAGRFSGSPDLFLIGRGPQYITALEAALKLKEVAGIRAEAFHRGEMKHGPLSLVSEGTPVILFYDEGDAPRAELSAAELAARGAHIFTVGPRRLRFSRVHLRTTEAGVATPIPQIVPMQLLAYEVAKLRQLDPDHPRNLAKSVTVL